MPTLTFQKGKHTKTHIFLMKVKQQMRLYIWQTPRMQVSTYLLRMTQMLLTIL